MGKLEFFYHVTSHLLKMIRRDFFYQIIHNQIVSAYIWVFLTQEAYSLFLTAILNELSQKAIIFLLRKFILIKYYQVHITFFNIVEVQCLVYT